MLTIETYLAADTFGGTGLFVRDSVKKDAIVWTFNPLIDVFYSMEEYLHLPAELRNVIARHVYPTLVDGVQGVMYSLDNDRYTNHSYTPNVGAKGRPAAGAAHSFDAKNDNVYALTDIAAGEEITANYFHFLPDGFADFYSDKIPLLKFLLEKGGPAAR